jgi:tetratricopeptide (TPR) repeat protein
MWLWLAGITLAAPLRFPAGPDATAEVLPPTNPGRIDILVHDRAANLRPPSGTPPADGIRAVRAMDLGGTWVVTLWPEDAGARASVRREGARWVVDLATATPPAEPALAGPVPTADAPDPGCGDVPAVPLVPLHGADMLQTFPASEFVPTLPGWAAAEPTEVSWDRVDALRTALFETPHVTDRAAGLYELGALHRDLGHAREAAYYFGAADAAGADHGLATLQRAGALLRAGEWAAAAEAAAAAARAGAPDAAALEVEGIATLFGGGAETVVTGRALAATSDTPETGLVAGALLLRGGCFAAAAAPLRRASTVDVPARAAMARLLLTDALVLAGDLDGADTVLGTLSEATAPHRWRGLMRARSGLLAILRMGPEAWPTVVPGLERAARTRDEEGAEALFLLGQLGERLGEPSLALASYTALVDRHRGPVTGEPGKRLFGAWRNRIEGLLADHRDIDALATHAGAWRPGLAVWLDDPAPLRAIADADERQGLTGPALDVLAAVADAEATRGLDDRATILAIAGLYRATGRLPEAVEALDVLARRPPDVTLAARATVLRARVAVERGDRPTARALYAEITTPPVVAAEAALRGALLAVDAGGCDPQLPLLLAEPGPLPPDLSAGVVHAALARSLAACGRSEDARVAAHDAATSLADPHAIGLSHWLAGERGADPKDLWSRLHDAEEAWQALRTRVSPKYASTPVVANR